MSRLAINWRNPMACYARHLVLIRRCTLQPPIQGRCLSFRRQEAPEAIPMSGRNEAYYL